VGTLGLPPTRWQWGNIKKKEKTQKQKGIYQITGKGSDTGRPEQRSGGDWKKGVLPARQRETQGADPSFKSSESLARRRMQARSSEKQLRRENRRTEGAESKREARRGEAHGAERVPRWEKVLQITNGRIENEG